MTDSDMVGKDNKAIVSIRYKLIRNGSDWLRELYCRRASFRIVRSENRSNVGLDRSKLLFLLF